MILNAESRYLHQKKHRAIGLKPGQAVKKKKIARMLRDPKSGHWSNQHFWQIFDQRASEPPPNNLKLVHLGGNQDFKIFFAEFNDGVLVAFLDVG